MDLIVFYDLSASILRVDIYNYVKITQIIVIKISGVTNKEIKVYTNITNFKLPLFLPYGERDTKFNF